MQPLGGRLCPARLTAAALAAGAVLGLAAPRALAGATLYASASSVADKPCTQALPCRLDHAVGAATDGDVVVVLPGTYSISQNVKSDKAITIEGQPGQPRPSLIGASNLADNTLTVSGGATVRHLEVETTGTAGGHDQAALSITGGLAEDLLLLAGPGATHGEALLVNDSSGGTTVRTVLARTQATGGTAVSFQDGPQPGTASAYNLTAVGESSTASAVRGDMTNGSALIKDSILFGEGGGLSTDAGTKPIDVGYSDFSPSSSSSYVDQGGNISAAPVFVGAGSENFHEAPTSPTIDTGSPDPQLSATDLDGNQRTLGSAPDMGAYEYVPPAPAPLTIGPPVLGVSVTLQAVSGVVRVEAPHTRLFTVLSGEADVPVGSIIDTTHGAVSLTSAINNVGVTRTGTFNGGRFIVGQSVHGSGRANLRLVGGSFRACRANGLVHGVMTRRAGRPHPRPHRVVRQLWGSDNGGKFTTIGKTASAAVRGTVWLTQDRCDGTLVKVFKGHVVVYDLRHRRYITLGPGQSYLARGPR